MSKWGHGFLREILAKSGVWLDALSRQVRPIFFNQILLKGVNSFYNGEWDDSMESIKEQLRLLIEEGGKFTFNNFCFPHRHPREFGGEDSPEWLSCLSPLANRAMSILVSI